MSCAFAQSCVDGACVADPCAAVTCEPGQACTDGHCSTDPCNGIACEAGQSCRDGVCSHDPCFNVVCPPEEICRVVEGAAQCYGNWPPIDDPNYHPDAGPTELDMGTGTGPGLGDFGTVDNTDAALLDNPDMSRSISQTPESVAGCGCRTPGRGATGAFWAFLPLLLAPVVRRRRR